MEKTIEGGVGILVFSSYKKTKSEKPLITVTILSGFGRSGKTTILRHIFTSNKQKLNISVIFNYMA